MTKVNKKKIKSVKDISDDKEYSIEELQEALKEAVKDGMLAVILSKKEDGTIEPSYINASQVFVKCPHCNNIVNVGKKNPEPKSADEKVIEGLEDGIKEGFIKEVPVNEGEERRFKMSEDGYKHIKGELKENSSMRLFLWNLIYNMDLEDAKKKGQALDVPKILFDSIAKFIESEGLWEIIDDIIEAEKDGSLKGFKISDSDEFRKLVRLYVEKYLNSKKGDKPHDN